MIPPAPQVSAQRRPHTSVRTVLGRSVAKFSPREQVRNPVMFVVYVYFLFVLLITLVPSAFPDVTGPGFDADYYLLVAVILFATLWFANLAESIAEAQSKAQADSLREARTGLRARQVLPDGARLWVPSGRLHVGDRIEVRPNEVVAVDGDVVQGAAVIDESMMTGESAPVVRESGGDRTSVIAGSRVLQGTVTVRATSEPGASFLDKMIALVEGTRREKSPNEVALTIILAALTSALLLVVVSLAYLLRGTAIGAVDLATLVALIVCLIPTTIGGLLSAVGISGVNRVGQANVVAKSGRAVEAAGDLDVLILDKTGTITVGNRLAVQFIPAPGEDAQSVMKAALLVSAFDETPEGRSIVRLAALRGVQSERVSMENVQVVPFSAERQTSGIRFPDGREAMKGSVGAMERALGPLPLETRRAAHEASRKGMTPLAIGVGKKIVGIVVLKDVVKPGIRDRLSDLKLMGIRTVMCTGDNRLTAEAIARESGVDEFIAEAKPETKLSLINREKQYGHLVAMSGDGTNDAPALARADVGLAMNSGTSAAKEAGNMVDLDSDPTKLIEVVSIGKQLLITRGALTTFSITNDVAKYFAIIPGLFVGVAGVASLNLLGLPDPQTAVLATLLFNALMIPVLIPLALRGVSFRPQSAVDLLRRNLVIYGVGGLVSAFAGIKLLYLLLAYLEGVPALAAIGLAARHLLGGL
ncbi:MAG TPA: potassium-transporting ATPase subunit KdpB [Thermoplasmata archaeon]|nr:potassium-transporting ATPase subunit KdpB [Thermoplasmata archaeon]HUJ77867.1 potassium-transporting ATPase subunit KdpB [Thermoplasmata archaeon]